MWSRRQVKASTPPLTMQQTFDARPLAVNIKNRQSMKNGGLRLIVPLQPRGYQKWLLRIPENATRRVELDPPGVEVFVMCDGHNSVRQMARKFAKHHQVDQQEAEMAVASFVRMLMQKGVIALVVDKQ